MKINIKALITICLAAVIIVIGCKKQEYTFGKIVTPKDLTLSTVIEGADAANPAGAGSGNVTIKTSATGAISYKIDFGDGNTKIVSEGELVHKYTNPGTSDYTIVVSAIGTGGVTTTTTQKITVFVAFEIPAAIMKNLTNGSSQTWVIDRKTPGHVGVGPLDTYTSTYYSAQPDERAECLYDDEITFTKDGSSINMTINNKGQSFFTAAATAFYGKSGGDNCYDLDVTGVKKLAFMDATSGSTSANSTRIQFTVPGNGLIAFGTGGTTYELMELTATNITVRSIGIDGLAWYQKFKLKP
ncbi:PKD domain-containing protein [Mucilaginibacter rigui]|uniref:PKD domain-containing protein n=1 Tax=Mucilaginibacter rigui TaxID=534635 RepID=A0ABR7X4V3_9SPHI|nr:PKD domain-containing protein [Mucilaginibacter rigui]MBD1384660.1 PKD domain-containing protein [Mucilaginibacter rigui]